MHLLASLAVCNFSGLQHASKEISGAGRVFTLLYSACVVSGMGFATQIWVIQNGGPVFVSGYLALQTMFVAVIASIALGEEFYLGGIIGAVLIVAGLYLVVWGKNEEVKLEAAKYAVSATSGSNSGKDLVEPLLPSSR